MWDVGAQASIDVNASILPKVSHAQTSKVTEAILRFKESTSNCSASKVIERAKECLREKAFTNCKRNEMTFSQAMYKFLAETGSDSDAF